MMQRPFDYAEAFSRNIGWVTETEQAMLRTRRVAIAGVGGVGGSHLLTLTRLGIGRFNLSDLDTFELANFNRQAGATLDHLGHPKVEVVSEMAWKINPELQIKTFPEGINVGNLDRFLEDVDLFLDGLDFFAVEIRRAAFAACAKKGIPAITAAPLGMGVALLNFLPGRMTFEEYFRLEGHSENEQLLRFLLGLSPAMLQMPYLVDDTRVDLANHKGPSTSMASVLCAGVAATHALKILLRRGKVPAAPRGVHFDAYRNRLACTWRPGGNANPAQRLGLKIARKRLSARVAMLAERDIPMPIDTPIQRILDLARWAPSGDNTQPWRFEILEGNRFLIYAYDTRDWCVYDRQGRASQLAVGALLETIAIAASGDRLVAAFSRREESPEANPIIEVTLSESSKPEPDILLPYIRARVTQRRPLSTKPLTVPLKRTLEEAVGPVYRLVWIEGWRRKSQIARLLFGNARIRLTIPEAYEVHKRIIHWDAQFSKDRIPDQAIGLDPVALKLMKWAMQSWNRLQMLNRYFAGTWMPRIQLDLFPALHCAAHFAIVADKPLNTIDDYLVGGRAMQRFWLTASRLGLQFQPEMTPLIFSSYIREKVEFTGDQRAHQQAEALKMQLDALLGEETASRSVFMGRVGFGELPASRSLRQTLQQLLAEK
jgi:molybdopterin/thiamine biosynthesis adenylyltransferase